jgi:hypothetical protein
MEAFVTGALMVGGVVGIVDLLLVLKVQRH